MFWKACSGFDEVTLCSCRNKDGDYRAQVPAEVCEAGGSELSEVTDSNQMKVYPLKAHQAVQSVR